MSARPVHVRWILFLTVWSIRWDFGAANYDTPNFEAAFQGKCGPNSPCVQLCVELHDGTFECECREGFRLLEDGYSCVESVNMTLGEDSEEEWIRSNRMENNLIHEHHDQQRDLQVSNYRRSQSASPLSYSPLSETKYAQADAPAALHAAGASTSAPRPLPFLDKPIDSAHNLQRLDYWKHGKSENRENRNNREYRENPPRTTAFSFANKLPLDAQEFSLLFGGSRNEEKVKEALQVSSSGSTDEDNSTSSEELEDDEDEEDDDMEVDDLFEAQLRYLHHRIQLIKAAPTTTSTSPRSTSPPNVPPAPAHPHPSVLERVGDAAAQRPHHHSFLDEEEEDASVERNRITITDNFELDQSEIAAARFKSLSGPAEGEDASPPTQASSSPSPTSTSRPALRALSSSPAPVSAEDEEVLEEEDLVAPSSPQQEPPQRHQCPLQCQNAGWCSWEGREGPGSASSLEKGAEELTGHRCLCPMGYHGSTCEIEDGSDGSGYTSGLFRGQSWAAFPVLHDAYMSDQISLEFRPETPNGILLLTGERDDLSGDFLALYIRDGYLEFRFDCGSGSGMVRSSEGVNLEQWNKANILRRRWDGWMQLNDGPFTQGRSKGLFSRITFRQPVFIGGAGNMTLGAAASSSWGSGGTLDWGATGGLREDGRRSEERKKSGNKVEEESEFETESPSLSNLPSQVLPTPSTPSPSALRTDGGLPTPATPPSDGRSGLGAEEEGASALPVLRQIGGFLGCIRNLVINDRTYRFGLEPAGDAIQGLDLENCNDQGVCDLLSCQHGGQCIVQKDENPTCLCPLGFTGHLCETPLDLQIPSFNGSSYLKYGGLGLSRVLSWLELEVIVKPDAMDGLILYNGYKTDGMGDFISLVIDQGYFEFAMDLGTGTAIIRSDHPVVLGEWHRILISRTSRLIFMRIDNQSPLMALTPGAFTQLSLPHNLFLGGIPDPQWLSPKVKVHGGFSGCIQKLVINEKPLRIMGSAMSGVNLENCAHPCLMNPCDHGGDCVPELDSFKCHCPLGYRDMYCQTRMDMQVVVPAPKLIGDSYLRFTHSKIIKRISGSRLNLSFRIRTSLSRGLILWAGRKLMTSASDFISVGLRNGFIHTSFSLGSGQTNIAYNYTTVHDGQWHLVRIIRNEQEASLSVDDGPPVIGVAPGKLRQLNINDGLYIGGLDDPRHQSMNKYSEGLVGCITDLILDKDYRVSLLQDASEGRNVDYCD